MPIRILEAEKEGHRKGKTDFRQQRQKEYIKKHGKPEKKRIQIKPKVSDRMQKLRDNLASVTGGEWGKKSGGRIGLKEGGRGTYGGGPSKPKDPKGHKQPLPPGYWKDRLKDLGKRYPRPRENLIEKMGGSEKAKPHSTKEGRVASGKRRIRRILARQGPGGGKPKPQPGPGGYDPPKWKRPERIMTPLRAKKGIGGILKKIVSKLKPKGKGLGSGVKPSEMHEIIPKKDRKLYLKEKLANPHKRVKKGHGGSAAQQHYLQHGYGPHKIQLRSGKPKLAKKGW